jgi:hypothetical protein
MSEKLLCHPDPCASCPYRRDTPPGVWAPEEYRKLPAWDDPMNFAGVFLCHHSNLGARQAVCRGWLEVHGDNLQARMTGNRVEFTSTAARFPTKVPLYKSGAQACAAGLRGVRRPNKAARRLMQKLTKARDIAKK